MSNAVEDSRLRPLFDLNERLSSVLRSFSSTHTLQVRPSGMPPPAAALLFAVGKGLKTHEALLILCRSGYAQDAKSLLRVLYEVALGVRWIMQAEGKDRHNRALRWLDYDWVVRFELLRMHRNPALGELGVALTGTPGDAEKIERGAKKAQEAWGFWPVDKKGRWRTPRHWSGMSLAKLSEEVGWSGHYATVYALASIQTHASVRAANDFVRVSSNGAVWLDFRASDEGIEEVLVTACVYLIEIARHWGAMPGAGALRGEVDAVETDLVSRLRAGRGEEVSE